MVLDPEMSLEFAMVLVTLSKVDDNNLLNLLHYGKIDLN